MHKTKPFNTMKKLFFSLIFSALALSMEAQTMLSITGHVVNEAGEAIPYATAVLLREGEQQSGVATDDEGAFTLQATAGSYTLLVQFLGYETDTRTLELDADLPLGEICLKSSSTEIDEVVVEAQLIRREADRFVVDVANSPLAIGKDGVELLKTAPGVWMGEKEISVNGASGTKVYINERELKMEGDQLLLYLRSLHAEQIQKIEVIPLSGADYDGDTAAGIIKITLKRQQLDGLMGSASYYYRISEYGSLHNPYLSLNYNRGKLNLYGSGWLNAGDDYADAVEQTDYLKQEMHLHSTSRVESDYLHGGGMLGAVYQINERHSLGLEMELMQNSTDTYTPSEALLKSDITRHNQSIYDDTRRFRMYTVTFNWIHKLDTLGSQIKLLADYTYRRSTGASDNQTRAQINEEAPCDSLYRERSIGNYNIFTTTLALEKWLSPTWQLKAGAKYTHNDTRNEASYRYLHEGIWSPSTVEDYAVHYTENIGALYLIGSGRVGRLSLTAGLRAELTFSEGRLGEVKQNYFSLFPNANLAWQIDKAGKHSLVASYSRTIRRPGFWDLTPTRRMLTDYTYQTGNPSLEPAFRNNYSLTLVMWHRYTLTAGINQQVNEIQQVMESDPQNPDMLLLTLRNFPDYNHYYVSLSAPAQLTKWWQWNTNFTYLLLGQRLEESAPVEYHSLFQAYTAMTFSLPAKFTFEASYNFQSRAHTANMTIEPRHDLGLSIKKRLWKDQLTLSFSANSLLDRPTILKASQRDFRRSYHIRQSWGGRSFTFGISWNFATGKSFRAREVEAGNYEERSRM